MKKVLALFSILFYTSLLFAQEPNDCINAITVCGNGNFISDATGIGTVQEVSGCGGEEHNSIWLKINIVQSGTLGFDLIPNNSSILVDYDFWVFGPNKTCGTGLGSPIRCATTNPNLSGATDNHTGMYASTIATQAGPAGAGGNGYVRWLTVTVGQFYYICVDRPVGDGGFTIQWTGSATLGTGAFPPPPLANNIPDYKSCSTTPNVSIFDLNSISTQINSNIVSNTIDYYPTLSKAIDQLSPLSNLMNNTSNPQLVYARVTDNNSGCYSISSFNLVVNTIPTASMSTLNTSICDGENATIIFSGTPNASIEYSVAGNAQTAVLDGAGVFTLSQPLSTTTTYGLTKVKSTDALGTTICTLTLTDSMVITVKPIPNAIAIATASTICSGTNTAINLTSLISGTTFTWTAAQTGVTGAIPDNGNIINQLVNTTGAISGNIIYTITPKANGCIGLPINETITVNPIPVASATPLLATICSGDTINIPLNSNLSGTTFDWTVTQNNTFGANSGNGLSIVQAVTTSNNIAGTVDYTIIPISSGCIGQPILTTIIVNPTPVASATAAFTSICSGNSTAISLTSTVIGTTYSWTVVENAVSGALANSGNSISQLLNATSTTSGNAIYSITPVANGCTGLTINSSLTVVIAPTANINYAGSPFCSSETIGQSVTLNGTNAYTGGLYSAPVGLSIDPSTGLITPSLSNVGTYIVTYTIPASNGCSAIPTNTNVTIKPKPIAIATPSSNTICSLDVTSISLSSTTVGTTYNWSVVQNNVSGAATGNGTSIVQTLTNTGILPGTAVYTIVPSALGCTGNAIIATINVNPLPSATITGTTTICSGTSTVVHIVGNPNATITYTINNGTNQTVLLDNSGTANILTGNLIADTTYQLIKITDSGIQMCEKMLTDSVVISVIPIPIINANVASSSICSGQSTGIILSSNAINTTYSWTVSPSNVIGATAGNGNVITQNLTNLGIVPENVTYTILANVGSCQIPNIAITITVKPIPNVSINPSMQTICSSTNTAISLSSTIVGTTFTWTAVQNGVSGAVSGTGVSINDFLSTLITVGTATYTVIPMADSCPGPAKSITVSVNPLPIPAISDGVICVNQATNVPFQTYLLDSQLSNVTFDFAWYLNDLLIPENNSTHVATQSGTYAVKATNSTTGCVSLLTSAIVIDSFPGLSLDTIQTAAFSENASIIVTVLGGNGNYLYSIDNGSLQQSNILTDIEPGLHTVSVTDSNGCTNLTKTVNIIGYPKYFTPNGDGIHDTWNIYGLDASSKICIFDRYGKVIKIILPKSNGWDGTLNGYALPSNDYWFTVDYLEFGVKKVFKSHFTLKR
jgi:gliding motility-associated-like protein